MTGAAGEVGGPVVTQVPFATHHAEGIFRLTVTPVLAIVVTGIRCGRGFGRGAAQAHRIAQVVDALFLVADISRHAEVVAAVVQASGEQLGALVLVVDGGFTFTLAEVQARAEAVVLTEALADIQVLANAAIRADVLGIAAGRLIAGALRLQVDVAAQAGASRAYAIEEGIGPLEHFDPLDAVGGHDLSRQDAVQAIE
ncbi:hypothetical protein D9M71_500070 [compost metagenome]